MSHSKYVFLIALAIAGLVSLLLMDISYFLGIIVGYIVSLIIFQIIIKMSDLISVSYTHLDVYKRQI